jgi:hypothetical protein
MGEATATRITCEGCGKTYAWKPELAGKRVKCKCGHAIQVPQSQQLPAQNEDDMYDLAPSEEQVKPKRPPSAIPAAVTAQAAATGTSALPYQAPPVRDRMSTANLVDMTRDAYVPAALFTAGVLLYLACFAYHYHLSGAGVAVVSIGVFIMLVIKAVLLVGFALVIATPLGVSFGGIWTATLKLAAIAVFCDGLTSWVDLGVSKMSNGTFGSGIMGHGVISLPVALGVYWTLLIYLFSMDSGDSWTVVLLLSVFDLIVKVALFMLVLGTLLHAGGVSAPGIGVGSAPLTTHTDLDDRVDDLQNRQLLIEARKYLSSPHNVNYLTPTVEEWYKAGAKTVYFEISRNMNGKPTAEGLIIEMPENKNQRQDCMKIGARVQSGQTPTGTMTDDGDMYYEVTLDTR